MCLITAQQPCIGISAAAVGTVTEELQGNAKKCGTCCRFPRCLWYRWWWVVPQPVVLLTYSSLKERILGSSGRLLVGLLAELL